MTSHHPSEVDSVASSPRSDHSSFDQHTRVRFMCSFGGKILPRPHDNQLRYVGGDTRIVAVHRSTNFSILLAKLSKLSGAANVTVKYQLPNEDLDALISVTTDEDVENMIEEYDRLAQSQNPRSARLRLFLFKTGDSSRASSISSLLGGSANRDHWFLDALNAGGSALERGRSEASSILSELPDYLFGLDNSDDPKMKTRNLLADNVSNSDPDSPAPALSSPFCSVSSVSCVPPIPNLPPVKTKPDNPEPVVQAKENQIEGLAEAGGPPTSQPTGYTGNPVMQYIQDSRYQGHAVQPIQVYYVPGPAPPGNVSVQPVAIPAPYSQQYHAVSGQLPLAYHHAVPGMSPLYGGGMRPGVAQPVPFEPYDVQYDVQSRVVQDGVNQQVFYGVRNSGMVPVYPNMVVPGGEDSLSIGSEIKTGRASQ